MSDCAGFIAGKPTLTELYTINCGSGLARDDNPKVTTVPDAHPIPRPANPTAVVSR